MESRKARKEMYGAGERLQITRTLADKARETCPATPGLLLSHIHDRRHMDLGGLACSSFLATIRADDA